MAATITVVCSTCRHKMRASADHIGRKGRCPNCKALIQISSSGQESVQTLAPATDARPAERRGASGTQVKTWLAGLIGVAATILLYALVFFPLHKTYLGQLMTARGPIQYEITLVTCWGLAILALKYWAVKRELGSAEMELELIPLEIGLQITPGNVDQFVDHIGKLPPAHQRSILARRIRGALEHFKHRNNVSEVQSYLSSQSELESSAVDSGYTLLRVFIWVCPILGFIGTVTGISDAVTGLANTLPSASATAPADPGRPEPPAAGKGDKAGEGLGAKMLAGMRTVTDGLAVAFDTTLVGLIAVCFLMFPVEALRKTEYGMLDRVEEFANESLLRRMTEEDASAGDPEMPKIVREALDTAFKEHQRWLIQWQAQVAKLGEGIGGDFEAAVNQVVERLSQGEAARIESVKGAAKAVEEMFAKVNKATDLQASLAGMEQLQKSINANTALMGQFLSQQKQLTEKYAAGDLGAVVQALQQISVRMGGPAASNVHLTPTVAGAPAASIEPTKSGGLFGRMFGRNSG